ncbi:hypothetical protein K0T92_07770 [Paenibacillus oenotherae]|uniref:HTH LytTR-type domain-containing protein n=1 Tax=Paenibacillus oenotherae TaxID=1435645 RepID=A0ABS7D445_9BACL|nr:hypothetical protein [Paenibacillus oenotherae]MBW7474639.1 hypothetical protein [Paenibacillus oenotherae]
MYMLDASGKRTEVDIKEVCMIVPRKEGPLFVTADGAAYRFPQTTRELVGLFGDMGFELIDRNAIINMDKAVRFDAVDRKVYFHEYNEGTEQFYATVSAANQKKVNHLIRESGTAVMEYAIAAGEGRGRIARHIVSNYKPYRIYIFFNINRLCYN